jgi:hypothetical protein
MIPVIFRNADYAECSRSHDRMLGMICLVEAGFLEHADRPLTARCAHTASFS